jgi:4-hydroxy-3-methylbut-2-en-1-yl diphosphate reductase
MPRRVNSRPGVRNVDDTAAIVGVLRRRFPGIDAPRREDICYATTKRQRAVKAVLPEVDLLIVIGSRNGSNSNRLVEVARLGVRPS